MSESPEREPELPRTGLLDREVEFVGALRRAGLIVSSAETVDATRAFGVVDILDRESVRAAFASTLCKRPAHRRTFDNLFDLYFPIATGDPTTGEGEFDPDGDGEGGEIDPEMLRELLRQALLDGDPETIAKLARQAVAMLGRADSQPGRQSWFTYRVLRQLNPDTLIADLLAQMLGDGERDGFAEKIARQTINERIRQFEEAVEAEVRRRLAEDRGIDAVERNVIKPLAEQVDFLRASRDDLAEMRRQVYPLARRLATRLTARKKVEQQGRLDFRRTVRASLGTGGVPLVTLHKPKKPHKPELVVFCDVSGSVSSFAHFTLMLVSALREQFSKVRAFAFIDTCDEITRYFSPGLDLADAMSKVVREADLVWFDGHSDYGHSFEVLDERFPDAITPKTSLLVLGDGRNNYRASGADALKGMAARARHTYWLNPEPQHQWGSGDSATRTYAPLVDRMIECRNVEQLTEFVTTLLPG
ncbi:MAG TPA: VWA domain-containing protein [Mycobacteriales bacterium]|nr:VWA domain-containing protein [Mycobacteriales bacterium]